ncbi:MAG: cupin domain-containing protein [Eubacteriales bacterium]|nr:cupin domain-containing protein [Eubacteriales bacterium]
MTAQQIIDALGLEPLPVEGGMVLQTYKSSLTIDGQSAGTTIYYLLSDSDFSHLHCLTGDEIYHFYLGDPVEMLELLPDGTTKITILGPDILNGQCVQHLVPAGNWQGSHLLPGGQFALLGTTMCPGYSDDGYTHGNAKDLTGRYPEAEKLIYQLTGCREE